MSQDVQIFQRSTPEMAIKVSNLSVPVPQTGDTTLITIPTASIVRIFCSFSVADNLLDAFKIYGRPNMDAADALLYSLAADYTSPIGILVGTSGDLTSQAAGTTGWFILDVRGIAQITVKASSAGVAGSTVSAYAGGS